MFLYCRYFRALFFSLAITLSLRVFAAPSLVEITPQELQQRIGEIFQQHAKYHSFNPLLTERVYALFLEELDPANTYFLKSEVLPWIQPEETFLQESAAAFNRGDFSHLQKIFDLFCQIIPRRNAIDSALIPDTSAEPKMSWKRLKEASWATTLEGIEERILTIQMLQMKTLKILSEDLEISRQRLQKRKIKHQEPFLSSNPKEREAIFHTLLLKSVAASLDSHSVYMSPSEAEQFLIHVQQKLVGLGVQIRDDCDGFTIIKILEDSPAKRQNLLRTGDKIVAIDGQNMIGNDIQDVVSAIRGQPGTTVSITFLREGELATVSASRDEVILKESRMEAEREGNIVILRLFCFYESQESNSASDLRAAFQKLQAEGPVEGILLDLRDNLGGVLTQALEVTGLFLRQGIIACMQEHRNLHRLANPNSKPMWEGPLLVLVNSSSASAAEIVAGALQDYGRAIIVGDAHTYGKGSFQTLTIQPERGVNRKGEYTVTRGIYYTPSGNTPQLIGITPDLIVPSWQSFAKIGEKHTDYPLEAEKIEPQFEFILRESPFLLLTPHRVQKKLSLDPNLLSFLKRASCERIAGNTAFQQFLQKCEKHSSGDEEVIDLPDQGDATNEPDFQYQEAVAIFKDLLTYASAHGSLPHRETGERALAVRHSDELIAGGAIRNELGRADMPSQPGTNGEETHEHLLTYQSHHKSAA